MRRISVSTFPRFVYFEQPRTVWASSWPPRLVTLWQKMNKVGGGRVPEFLSTHPAPENREQTLKNLVSEMMPY